MSWVLSWCRNFFLRGIKKQVLSAGCILTIMTEVRKVAYPLCWWSFDVALKKESWELVKGWGNQFQSVPWIIIWTDREIQRVGLYLWSQQMSSLRNALELIHWLANIEYPCDSKKSCSHTTVVYLCSNFHQTVRNGDLSMVGSQTEDTIDFIFHH